MTLVEGLYRSPATQTLTVAGSVLQVPPWLDSSTECSDIHLQAGFGLIGKPSFSNYLVVSDELSELAIVTALANRDDRMLAIHHTILALESSTYRGMPCWIARVSQGSLTCFTDGPPSDRFQDTASDATARFGLAYYFAANNPNFPAESRAIYRAAGDALAARHLAVEYANGCFHSGVSGRTLCDWVGGGARSASQGVGGVEMWIGYYPDIIRFLIAANRSTGNSVYLQRAEEVVDQFLIASSFSGSPLTVGHFNFSWDTGSDPIQPKRGNAYFWDPTHPAWDDSDAPRALWMGDVLRAIALSTGAVPPSRPYSVLGEWIGKMQAEVQGFLPAHGFPPDRSSCIQFNQDGTPYVNGKGETNCGTDYYFNGLGAGLFTSVNTGGLRPRVDEALGQFGWNATRMTWNSAPCFGIYRGVRPVKALAAGIGLDAAAYACPATSSLCGVSPNELCLASGRFKVTASWRTAQGAAGEALPVVLTVDTGYFWFFGPSNVEVVIKVLDGCFINGHFWVFAAGLTDVNVDLKVLDTQTGVAVTYSNPKGVSFRPIQDTTALASCQ
ncbi:MAG TPA: hypothetical protein VHR45_24985 [Thermoanaerobaculia bacterium]|nr:hypothetical protein [Thermoanaerobaculia bacterium]